MDRYGVQAAWQEACRISKFPQDPYLHLFVRMSPTEGSFCCVDQGTIASEEEDLPVAVEETFSGNYVVVFDPLDGSSNIDAGISTGSIFGIYDPNDECSLEDMDDPTKMMENCVLNVCQPGTYRLTLSEGSGP